MESLRPLHKATFTDVLDYGIYLYKKHFKKIFLLNLMFNIPIMMLITVVNPLFTDNYQDLLNPQIDTAVPFSMFSSVMSLYAVLFLYLAVNAIYGLTLKNVLDGSIIKIIYSDTVLKEDRNLKQVIKECFRQFGTLLSGRILYMVIQGAVFFALYIILTIGIFIITFASIGVFSSVTVSPWVTVVLSIIGILALLVAVFFIALTICFFNGKYWMFLPAICIEQKKTGATVERCNKIGRNSFYTIGLTYLFAYLIATFLPSILSSIVSLINIASGTMDIALLKIGSVFTQLITSLFQPLVTCILTALYITQRTKREGLDIENDLWEIKKEEAAKNRRWTAEALQ